MNNIAVIHGGKQPRRPHYIREWAARRRLKQVDLARELGADKSVVSRWFKGGTPSEDWQERLAIFFETDRDGIFRDPADTWLTRLFKERANLKQLLEQRTPDELDAIEKMIQAVYPLRKTG